jgi:hypothetical protein
LVAQKPLPNLAEKFMDDLLNDPGQTMIKVDRTMNIILDLAPTMPDEFPIPIPRGLYRRLNLDKLVRK